MKIAMDGPAGAGKSTVAKAVAARLNLNYLDTGAMYRAVAYVYIIRGIDVNDHQAVLRFLPELKLVVEYQKDGQHIFIDGKDVTPFIRTPEVSKGASDVAVIPDVRKKLVQIQRQVAEKYDVVMDGRDIGTYVLPDANYKFFITATPHERAKRRYLEICSKHPEMTLEQIEQDIIARDETDSNRKFAPLRQAEDAILIDTTNMGVEEVVAFVLGVIGDK
jgi:cytidylate kinase